MSPFRRQRLGLLLGLSLSACHDPSSPTAYELDAPPQLAIADAAHGGAAHFYLLPPLVPAPRTQGVFDPELLPEVRVCELARAGCGVEIGAFTVSSTPAVTLDSANEAYGVTWDTRNARLRTSSSYRIRVLVPPVELGFADLRVVSSRRELESLPSDVVGVVRGQPLRMRFRVEQGFVGAIRIQPGNEEIEVGTTAGYEAVAFDLHGGQLRDAGPFTWASSDPGTLGISRDGTGNAVAIGEALIAAEIGVVKSPPKKVNVFRRLAFVRLEGNEDIYSIRSNGSGLTNLTNSPEGDWDPKWSPDGTRILFIRGTGLPGSHQLWVMNSDGGNQINLTNNPALDHSAAAWSPDGARIAFVANASEDCCVGQGIYVMNADGSGKVRLTEQGNEPQWSPDGTKLVYEQLGIRRINADGTGDVQLDSNFYDAHPLWSPDGTRVLFSYRSTSGSPRVGIMNPDGTGLSLLTNTNLVDLEPRWSNDGTRITWSRLLPGPYQLWAMDVNGANQTNLTNGAQDSRDGRWSPDGKKILFWQTQYHPDTDQDKDIYIMNPDGSGQVNLTKNPAPEHSAVWRP